MGRRAKPKKGKPARKSAKNDGSQGRDLEKRLAEALQREAAAAKREAEALEQQAATSKILELISSSPTDIQPVLEALAESAARLCGSVDASIYRRDGDRLFLVAQVGPIPQGVIGEFFLPLGRGTVVGRSVLDGRTVHVLDLQAMGDEFPEGREHARRLGLATVLAVPLMRAGVAIGSISLRRTEAQLFSPRQTALLETFANQAVIAIENVRLFKELQARNRDLTATGEILRVIASSPTDLQPVFDTIAENAWRLLRGWGALVLRFDGQLLHMAAFSGGGGRSEEERRRELRERFPAHANRETFNGAVILDGDVRQIADIETDEKWSYLRPHAKSQGWRANLGVPMLHDGQPIGVISVTRSEPGAYSPEEVELLRTFADQAVIAIENVRLFKELQEKNRALTQAHAQVTETLDQQTATADILRVISGSPTDLQPVFDTIVEQAARLCDARLGALLRFDGRMIHLAAHTQQADAESVRALQTMYPTAANTTNVSGRALLWERPVHVHDMREDPELAQVPTAQAGHRTVLSVPMMREGGPIGAITMARAHVEPFSDAQIELLKTFAAQAVIAIENVRLFNETKEALEQQTATAEILRVISQSPTDVQPVFDAIVSNAKRLLDGFSAMVTRLVGDELYLAAYTTTGDSGDGILKARFPRLLANSPLPAQAVRERTVCIVTDTETDERFRQDREVARARGYRSMLTVPLLQEHKVIGVINVTRAGPGSFSDDEITLLKTFADQAVIAIENVRLFTELEEKNRALTQAHAQVTESLNRQTATSEILSVISTSPTDAQPVFDTIIRNAVRLVGGFSGVVTRLVGDHLHLAALTSTNPSGDAAQTALWPKPLQEDKFVHGQVISTLEPCFIADVESDASVPPKEVVVARARGYRSIIAVPLVRDARAMGSMAVTRRTSGPFADSEISLLRTFADQAVIAMENVRLFTELQARTGELTQSVEQLTALGEVSRAVSSTLDVETVLDTIVSRASQLAGAAGCSIYEYDEAAEQFELRATHHYDAEFIQALRAAPLRRGEGLMGRAAEMREPIQIPDITEPGAYQSSVRDTLVRFGYRALLSVPLLREDQIIGSLSFNRKEPGEFSPEVVDVLKTFATQSALAIQNARLFREIEQKSQELEAASRHKSEFLANMSHELRTPLNAIIGFSEVLTERMFGELNEKQDEYLKDIYTSGQHLLSLINDILDLSKIEAGRMELEAADFNLPSAIDNALILVRERATRRGITVGRTIDDRLGMLRGDERKVKQVLLNLLSNALKFTPEGGRIDVSAHLQDGAAAIGVTDTGVGIAPEDQEAIFEEFRQVGTADKKVEGTGLGLALSRKFIELHGGRIWVESELGKGSTFTFTLPLRREPDDR